VLESLAYVGDRVNMPIALAAAAALAAQHANGARAGLLWGAVDAAAENEPRAFATAALGEYEPHLERVRGATFDARRENVVAYSRSKRRSSMGSPMTLPRVARFRFNRCELDSRTTLRQSRRSSACWVFGRYAWAGR
jgi:hypothetical protein